MRRLMGLSRFPADADSWRLFPVPTSPGGFLGRDQGASSRVYFGRSVRCFARPTGFTKGGILRRHFPVPTSLGGLFCLIRGLGALTLGFFLLYFRDPLSGLVASGQFFSVLGVRCCWILDICCLAIRGVHLRCLLGLGRVPFGGCEACFRSSRGFPSFSLVSIRSSGFLKSCQ